MPIPTEANWSAINRRIATLPGAIKRDLGQTPVEGPVASLPDERLSRSRARFRVMAVRTAQMRFVTAMTALSEVGGSNRRELVSRLSVALTEVSDAIRRAQNVDFVTQSAPDDDVVMKYARELLKLVLDGGDAFAPRVAKIVAGSPRLHSFQQRWHAICRAWVSPPTQVSPTIETMAGVTAASSFSSSSGDEAIIDPDTMKDEEYPLSKNQWRVLTVLYDHPEHLLTVEAICSQLQTDQHRLSEATVKKFLQQFGRQKLTERPGRGHNGARLTDKGKALVERAAGAPKLPSA
jgi:DNA-binding MarR family transcriptional regulator